MPRVGSVSILPTEYERDSAAVLMFVRIIDHNRIIVLVSCVRHTYGL